MQSIFNAIGTAVDAVARALFVVGGVLLSAMMLIITADVVTRTLFGISGGAIRVVVAGGVELVRFTLLFSILCTLPAVVERGQVVVESFTTRMPQHIKPLLFAVYLLGFCAFGAMLAYGWYGSGMGALDYDEVTQDLAIPMAPLYFAAAACAAVLSVRSLICAFRAFAGKVTA